MRISKARATLLTCSLILTLVACAPQEPPAEDAEAPPPQAGFSTNPYCSGDTTLCSTLPGSTVELPPGCESYDQQCSRDFWSWQNFVALSWPGKILDAPEGIQLVEADDSKSVGDDGNRVWELWMDPDDVFLPNAQKPSWSPGPTTSPYCTDEQTAQYRAMAGRSAKAAVAFDLDDDQFFEATINQPLIDQDMNFVVFEIRMNRDEVNWVISNDLYNKGTVDNWPADKKIEMPGAAIETKAAWRILPDSMEASQKARYYSQWANILLDPDHVEGGSGDQPICVTRELGLIGFHIRHEGFWATFEQVDNVTQSGDITPTLFNTGCLECPTNLPPTDKDGKTIPSADYKWSLDGASAALYQGFPNVPSQITYAPGQEEFINADLNDWWQNTVLKGTVWQHYMLITTNWIELTSAQPIPALNTSLEPYLPSNPKFPQDCIDCHKLATNNNNVDMAQTFLVFRACPETAAEGESLPPNCTPSGVDTLAAYAGDR